MSGRGGIDSSGWSEINELFQRLRGLDPDARAAQLDDLCRGREHLRAEVESLLTHADRTGEFLKAPSNADVGVIVGAGMAGLAAGNRFGNYTITGVLGHGGMGIVYAASQERPRRDVALKVIRPGIASKAMLRRFEHEAQMLARLQHPGIAQIFEAGVADTEYGPQPYFAMELVRGVPIIEFAARRNVGTRQRLELVVKVCEAAEHAHQKGVVHRDLKPGNILVDDSGTVKVLDFVDCRRI